jgi:hypothetical protein
MKKTDYLKLQYQEALNQVRCHIDSRYKVLQFIGFYNAAVLTFGFSQDVFSTCTASLAAIFICILSAFVSLMGLLTEYSLIRYNKAYYFIIRKIEEILNKETEGSLEEIGVFTHGDKFKPIKPFRVNSAHIIFYSVLTIFWVCFCIYQWRLF